MMWCRVLTSTAHLYPAASLLIEIMLVMQGSSSVVERGFSTLRRNLRENRVSMDNKRLNQILLVKTNLNSLHKVIKNCDKEIISEAITLYHAKKKWRWSLRDISNDTEDDEETLRSIYGPPPAKKRRPDDDFDDENVDSDNNEDVSEKEESDSDWYIYDV